MMIDLKIALNYLNELFPAAKCALNYKKDYELLIATMLSAQVSDKAVNKVTAVLFDKYPTLEELSKATYDDIYSIIRPLGLAKNKTQHVINISRELLLHNDGRVPNDAALLTKLSGVGNKTKNVVLAELYHEPLLAVDTHVYRIAKRWGVIQKNDSVKQTEKKFVRLLPQDKINLINHQLIEFGRNICVAPKPKCQSCKLNGICPKKCL